MLLISLLILLYCNFTVASKMWNNLQKFSLVNPHVLIDPRELWGTNFILRGDGGTITIGLNGCNHQVFGSIQKYQVLLTKMCHRLFTRDSV